MEVNAQVPALAGDNIGQLRDVVYAQGKQFSAVASNSSLVFEREAAFAMQLFMSNKYLAGVALSNKSSVISAISNIAAIGISLNPASKLAYLVPRDGKACLDISYLGLMHIAQDAGAIKWGQAAIVRANDVFELNGIDSAPTHKYNPFGTDRGDIVGCYVVVKTDTDDYLTHTMTIDAIYSIRDRASESWKAYLRDKTKKTPWLTDGEEMIKKTGVKQAAKYWPRRERLDTAVHYLNTEGGEGLNRDIEVDVTPITPEQVLKIEALILETRSSREAFLKFARAESIESIPEHHYTALVAALEKKKLPACTAENFEQKKAGWKKLVTEGKRSVKDLISMIQTKELLTEEQRMTIDSWAHEND